MQAWLLHLRRCSLIDRLTIRALRSAPPPSQSPIAITVTGHQLKCGMQVKVVLECPDRSPNPDHRLVREVLRAIRRFQALASGTHPTIQISLGPSDAAPLSSPTGSGSPWVTIGQAPAFAPELELSYSQANFDGFDIDWDGASPHPLPDGDDVDFDGDVSVTYLFGNLWYGFGDPPRRGPESCIAPWPFPFSHNRAGQV